MNHQKGSALILIIFAVLLLVIGGVYLYPKIKGNNLVQIPDYDSSKKSESKDYSSQNLGFALKYPTELTVKEDTEEEFNKRGNGDFRKNFKGYVAYDPGKFLGAVVVLEKDQKYETNPFTLWVFDNPNNLTIDEWYKNYWYYPFVWGDFTYKGKVELAPKNEATISGHVAKSGVIDYQPGKPKFIYISKDQKMYLFRVIGEKGEKTLQSFNFIKSQETKKNLGGCKVGGCSGQLCVEEGKSGVSTCEFLQEYGCYRNAKCERQTDGKCGWTKTDELARCLQSSRRTSVDMPQ